MYGLTTWLYYPTLATIATWRGNNATISIPLVCAVTLLLKIANKNISLNVNYFIKVICKFY